jgi:hypothetical protein
MKRIRIYLYAAVLSAVLTGFLTGTAKAQYILGKFPSSLNFNRPKDNPNLPKSPGLTYTYKTENKESILTNQVTVTYDTTTLQGIRCQIIYDAKWNYVKKLGQKFLTSETYHLYAWDKWGNVWDFGKDSFVYLYNNHWRRYGINMNASWLAGKNGAIPRIIIPANT